MIVSRWLESVRATIVSRLTSIRTARKRTQSDNGFGTAEQLEVRSMLSAGGLTVTAINHHKHNETQHGPVVEAGRDEVTQEAKAAKKVTGSKPTVETKPTKVTTHPTTAQSHSTTFTSNQANSKPGTTSGKTLGRGISASTKPSNPSNPTQGIQSTKYWEGAAKAGVPGILELGNEVGNTYFNPLIDSLSNYGVNTLNQNGLNPYDPQGMLSGSDWDTAFQRLENIGNGLYDNGWEGAAKAAVPGILELGNEVGNTYFSGWIDSLSDYGANTLDQYGLNPYDSSGSNGYSQGSYDTNNYGGGSGSSIYFDDNAPKHSSWQ